MLGKIKKIDFSEFDLRKFDLTRKYDQDFSPADGIPWRDHVMLYAISLLMLLFIIWANLAKVDEVVRGDGRVIPSNEVQIIQNLEGGIVEEIKVQEGDVVDAGQTLLRLSNVQARADYEASNKKYYGLMASIARLQAEAEDKPLMFPDEVLTEAPEAVAAETAAYEANKKQIEDQAAVLESQKSQKDQEIAELRSRIANDSRVLKLSQDEKNMVAPLVERGSASKQELLQLNRNIAEQQGRLEELQLSLPRAEAAAKEATDRLASLRSNFRAEAQVQLSGKRTELSALRETLTALKDRSSRTEVISPVHGTVKDIKVYTVGGVVKPGESIMEVVPLEDQLLIEGRLKPADIAFVYPGQKSVVRVSAYDYSVYGSMEGKVVEVSPDSIVNERGESFYRVKVRTNETKLKKNGKELSIIPGMQTTLDFVTGEKWDPLESTCRHASLSIL